MALIPKYLSPERFDVCVSYTQHSGHAAELARKAVHDGIDIVAAVGGDGTVNEVARSLVHSHTALGIIPCGSGNGLARHLYIPMNPEGAMQVLADCQIKNLDYGVINDTPFFCTCGVGFDAFVSSKFAQSGRRGLLTYIENTLREGLKYHPDT
ncbi:MAG: diacylglycerol/lipid kinase family protein, partial [Bacteroidaceae bacterium]